MEAIPWTALEAAAGFQDLVRPPGQLFIGTVLLHTGASTLQPPAYVQRTGTVWADFQPIVAPAAAQHPTNTAPVGQPGSDPPSAAKSARKQLPRRANYDHGGGRAPSGADPGAEGLMTDTAFFHSVSAAASAISGSIQEQYMPAAVPKTAVFAGDSEPLVSANGLFSVEARPNYALLRVQPGLQPLLRQPYRNENYFRLEGLFSTTARDSSSGSAVAGPDSSSRASIGHSSSGGGSGTIKAVFSQNKDAWEFLEQLPARSTVKCAAGGFYLRKADDNSWLLLLSTCDPLRTEPGNSHYHLWRLLHTFRLAGMVLDADVQASLQAVVALAAGLCAPNPVEWWGQYSVDPAAELQAVLADLAEGASKFCRLNDYLSHEAALRQLLQETLKLCQQKGSAAVVHRCMVSLIKQRFNDAANGALLQLVQANNQLVPVAQQLCDSMLRYLSRKSTFERTQLWAALQLAEGQESWVVALHHNITKARYRAAAVQLVQQLKQPFVLDSGRFLDPLPDSGVLRQLGLLPHPLGLTK